MPRSRFSGELRGLIHGVCVTAERSVSVSIAPAAPKEFRFHTVPAKGSRCRPNNKFVGNETADGSRRESTVASANARTLLDHKSSHERQRLLRHAQFRHAHWVNRRAGLAVESFAALCPRVVQARVIIADRPMTVVAAQCPTRAHASASKEFVLGDMRGVIAAAAACGNAVVLLVTTSAQQSAAFPPATTVRTRLKRGTIMTGVHRPHSTVQVPHGHQHIAAKKTAELGSRGLSVWVA